MEKNTKPNKETREIADKYIWPAEGKNYSDFVQMEHLLNKIVKATKKRFPGDFDFWLESRQGEKDFADFIIGLIPFNNEVDSQARESKE